MTGTDGTSTGPESGPLGNDTDGTNHMEEAFADYVGAIPLPEDHELDEAECHHCGEPWDVDEWDERHVNVGPTVAEDWYYTCPGCGHETFEVGI